MAATASHTPASPSPATGGGNAEPAFSVVVANWNGGGVVGRCVGALVRAARRAGGPYEIIVVDDASDDGSAAALERAFPAVRVLKNGRNRGFPVTANRGVSEAHGPIAILCNNDLLPEENFITALLRPFADEARFGRVFGVSARTLDWESGAPNHVNMTGRWRRGRLELDYSSPPDYVPSHFVQGGACAVRREAFVRLGGFQHLFHPGYWEDYDLSYLALKAGLTNWYAPGAVALHIGQHSMRRRFGAARLSQVRRRNEWLWHWLNITDGRLLLEHGLWMGVHLARDVWRGDGAAAVKAFLEALRRLPAALAERRRRAALIRRSDRQVLRFRRPDGHRRISVDAAGGETA
ncbi:MAG: hypothetical protein Kow0059_05360 [Candidatus Sumerlaeia bacterium]